MEVVLALGASGALLGFVQCRQKERGENGDDRDDDQEFDQRKAGTSKEAPAGA
jgi:hypothetical protein